MNITDTIWEKMSNVFKPQRKFISVLLTTIMLIRGNVNFRNLSRYSTLCEKTFSRQFREPFDFAEFNMIGTQMVVKPDTLMIAAALSRKAAMPPADLASFITAAALCPKKGLKFRNLRLWTSTITLPAVLRISRQKQIRRRRNRSRLSSDFKTPT